MRRLQDRRTSAVRALLAVVSWFAVACLRAAAPMDDAALRMPAAGDYALHILTPSVLELTFISSPAAGDKPVDLATELRPGDFHVAVNEKDVAFTILGAKRRVLYAPIKSRDLRVQTDVYLQLADALPAESRATVAVRAVSRALAQGERSVETAFEPLRYSPAIHVNQEGYTPSFPKTAMVGYFIGTAGELSISSAAGFDLVDAATDQPVFHGTLVSRRDVGFTIVPKPYQGVYEAEFTKFDTPGRYRLVVPGLGASLPFTIHEGELLNITRAYALGLLNQRCGYGIELPFSRFSHDACHTKPAAVPMPPEEFAKAWDIIAKLDKDVVKPEHPELQLKRPRDQRFPFVRMGKVNVLGGHHDAGDYSKYTINSANLVHALVFAVDAFPGVADLDNLGLPESGDHVSDVLQEAKWEADFLARLQDEDGGSYFLVYPRERRYESGPPDPGDPQIVWPKTTAVTAAAAAALAQCAGSPAFQKAFPEDAKRYLAQAKQGWEFLMRAIDRYGKAGSYQRLTHYGDAFGHDDELAWAAAELFVATGDGQYEKKLFDWYPNPDDPKTKLWNWRRASFAYGNALRAYGFAVDTGRLRRNQVDAGYLAKCRTELRRAGDDVLRASEQNAYGVSYPGESKRLVTAGWFFPSDEAFDMTVAFQIQARPQYITAVLANLNFEVGCNPVNRCFLTGVGVRRQREIVHQFGQADGRVLPPSGIPIGALQSAFHYMDSYRGQLNDESWPRDSGDALRYPLYDRWSDAYNLSTEFVVVNQARSLASLAFWAAQTPAKTPAWKSAVARIVGPEGTLPLGQPVTFRLECTDLDLAQARIVWEAKDQEPAFGSSFTFVPRRPGPQWVEAEAALPDGRRVAARAVFAADAPVVFWVDGAIPAGATMDTKGGDTWDWIKPATKPPGRETHPQLGQHESALARGIHEHGFYDANETLPVASGDVLFAWVFIDPAHPPKTIMLEWNDGSNDHRAFWGPNEIPYGTMNTASQRPMGPIPPSGRWVRLDVPAKLVGLEGRNIKGMVFRAFDGRMRWDAAGKMSASAAKKKG